MLIKCRKVNSLFYNNSSFNFVNYLHAGVSHVQDTCLDRGGGTGWPPNQRWPPRRCLGLLGWTSSSASSSIDERKRRSTSPWRNLRVKPSLDCRFAEK